MGVVQEPVTDGIGEGRLADVIVVLGRGQLARDDGRPGAIAILEDLEQIAPLLVVERAMAKSSMSSTSGCASLVRRRM